MNKEETINKIMNCVCQACGGYDLAQGDKLTCPDASCDVLPCYTAINVGKAVYDAIIQPLVEEIAILRTESKNQWCKNCDELEKAKTQARKDAVSDVMHKILCPTNHPLIGELIEDGWVIATLKTVNEIEKEYGVKLTTKGGE